MPKIGETVRYGQSGLCKVEGKCEKDIGGQKQEYFVLSPLFKNSSIRSDILCILSVASSPISAISIAQVARKIKKLKRLVLTFF